MYVWNHEAYWNNVNISRWCKCIGYDASDELVGTEAEVEVDVGGWGTQWSEGLIASDRKLELDK